MQAQNEKTQEQLGLMESNAIRMVERQSTLDSNVDLVLSALK